MPWTEYPSIPGSALILYSVLRTVGSIPISLLVREFLSRRYTSTGPDPSGTLELFWNLKSRRTTVEMVDDHPERSPWVNRGSLHFQSSKPLSSRKTVVGRAGRMWAVDHYVCVKRSVTMKAGEEQLNWTR